MPTITPPPIVALPSAPDPNNRATFNVLAYPWSAALPTFGTQVSALGENVKANADDAAISAASAAANALSILGATGAALWVSGTTYAIDDVRYSPVTQISYRRRTAGAGTTDPSADATNWGALSVAVGGLTVSVVSATTQTALSGTHYVLTNIAATTVTLPAAPASGVTVWVTPTNGLTTNVIARNGQTIMGLAEDMVLDSANATVNLRFVSGSWRLV